MRRKAYNISRFICLDCGIIVPLPRNKCRPRESGHIKDIWRPRCGRVKKFKEVKAEEFVTTLEDCEKMGA